MKSKKIDEKKLCVAFDGYSASGKSLGAKLIAKKYKLKLLNSGLLYRYAALLILKAAIKGDDKIMIREYFSKLTFGHLEYVDKILTKIAIETGNEDYLTYIEKEEQEDKDEKEFMEAYGDWLFAVETYMTVRDKHIFVTELMEADEDFGYRVYALYDAGFKHKAEPSIIACQVIDAAENKYGEDYDKCLLDLLISATYLNEGKRDKLYQYSDSDGRTSYWDS